jgi:HEAT repeat protein
VGLIRRRYGAALVRTLRAGLAEQILEGGPGLAALGRGSGVMADLRNALGAAQPGARRLAVELLGRLDEREGLAAATAAIEDPDPAVRAAALRSLASLDPGAAGRHATTLTGDPDPAVRAEAAAALAAAGQTDRAVDVVTALLAATAPGERCAGIRAAGRLGSTGIDMVDEAMTDPSAAVRATAAEALGLVGRSMIPGTPGSSGPEGGFAGAHAIDSADVTRTEALLLAALDDEALLVRRAAARALAQRPDWAVSAVEVLRTGSDRAQAAALLALADGHELETTRPAVRDWAIGQIERATTLRRHAAALGNSGTERRPETDPVDPSPDRDAADFLRSLVERRGRDVENRLLAAIAALGTPEANGPIRRSLHSDDADTRAQAIEALESIGDPRLGRALARLLDADGEAPVPPGDVLRELATDDDHWIRLLAVRATAERLSAEWRSLADLAAADPEPAVRAAIAPITQPGGGTMPQTDRALGEIDRMMFLRRVPLFSQLDPEDLQRLAAAATERLYAAGEALVREGELGDELIVIVEGGVRVVRSEAAGERVVRTYEAGDHIGELAVLRDRPRAATVIAEGDGVRGLVIGGDGLRALLRERPEAAMAMLATLAERISAQ